MLTSVVFSLGGFINAQFAKNFDQVNWIPTFVLTPLTYFGGVFYSISLLPEWARHLSYANPILHMVNAFRYGFLGTSDVNVYVAFGIMMASAAGAVRGGAVLHEPRHRHARVMGTARAPLRRPTAFLFADFLGLRARVGRGLVGRVDIALHLLFHLLAFLDLLRSGFGLGGGDRGRLREATAGEQQRGRDDHDPSAG